MAKIMEFIKTIMGVMAKSIKTLTLLRLYQKPIKLETVSHLRIMGIMERFKVGIKPIMNHYDTQSTLI